MELLDRDGLNEQEYLKRYRPDDFQRPSVACDMVIFTVTDGDTDSYRKIPEKQLRVLLIERGAHPFLGAWALPGGFVRPGETTAQAAERELREETGVGNVYLEQLYTFSDPGRDPRAWVMSCSHMALIDGSRVHLAPGDDAKKAAWFQLSYELLEERKVLLPEGYSRTRRYELSLSDGVEIRLSAIIEHCHTLMNSVSADEFLLTENNGLAFDHARILACAVERLRGKLEYTQVALHLMPERFTLTQLQQVYEVILGKPLFKAAFRRKIAPLVRETGEFTENAGHRPSQLYRRNWEEME